MKKIILTILVSFLSLSAFAERYVMVTHDEGKGVVLSGSYSPTLQSSIGLARVDQGYKKDGKVMIRNKMFNIDFVSPRFIERGKISV